MDSNNVVFESWGDAPAAMPASDAPVRITVRPQDASASPDVTFESWGDSPGYAGDVARSIPTGLVKGATGLLGLPAAAHEAAMQGGEGLLDLVASHFNLPPEWVENTRQLARTTGSLSPLARSPSTQQMREGIENVTGPLHQPQTTPGRYAETIAEFVPGAGRKLATMAVAPGVASEAVGQMMQGSRFEPIARAGAAIATGGLGALLTRPRSAQQAVRNAMPDSGLPRAKWYFG